MTAAQAAVLLVAFGTSAYCESPGRRAVPSYSVESILHSATNRPGPFAPNTIATIYGGDLSYGEETAPAGKSFPPELAGARVLANGQPAPLHYVCPRQINFLIPASFVEGPVEIRVVREGISGAAVKLVLQNVAPGLYQRGDTVIATRGNGSLVTAAEPASPGDALVLYGTGLGYTALRLGDGEIPLVPPLTLANITIQRLKELRVLLNGNPVDASSVLYAGLSPGSVGLYQINFVVPDNIAPDPEIRVAIGDVASPEGFKLPVAPQLSSPAARLTNR